MQITVKRGEHPNVEEVLTALANNVFYTDGSPWQATPEQVAALTELFGTGNGCANPLVDNVVPLIREGR